MKKLLLTGLIIFSVLFSFAQNLKLDGVINVRLRNTGEILSEDNQVKGYYYFYQVDKADKKNFNYMLKLVDENLREIKSINIIKPKNYVLVEGGYNGEAFGFLFYDTKMRSTELISYDKSLNQLGSVVKQVKGTMNVAFFNNIALGGDAGHIFLVPVKEKGFIYYGFEESKKSKYMVVFYDNKLNEKWKSTTESDTREIEVADDAFQTETHIGSLITRRAKITSRDASYDLLVNEIGGKELFKMEIKDDKYNVAAAKIIYDEATNNIMIFGEYFNGDDKEYKSASLGYFYFMVDLNGKLVNKKFISWEKDISKVLSVDKSGKMDKGLRVFVHEIVRTADGDVFVIGEQYKKAASGAGIAMAVLGGNNSRTATVQLEVFNLMIFQFSKDLDIKNVHLFEKDRAAYLLPSGAEWVSSKMLAYYALSNGWFDFTFCQMNKEKTSFAVCYVNYDKEKGEKAKNIVGAIVYTPEKTFSLDKTPLNRKSTDYYVKRAKQGYVMVAEYFRKEKNIDIRLEKINY